MIGQAKESRLDSELELLKQKICTSFLGIKRDGIIIAITSCTPGEGVTTTASNLAASFSLQPETKVLLVDGNVAAGSSNRLFNGIDLIQVTSVPWESSLTKWPINQITSNLHVLSAVKTKRQPSNDSFYRGVNGELQKAAEQYQVILLDCPPIPKMFSSLHLFRMVDGVILVLEAEKVRYEVASRNIEIVTETGGQLLGCILNKRRYPIPKFVYNRL